MVNRIYYGILILLVTTPNALAQTVTIQTDNNVYNEGDTIVISGKVSTILDETTPVLLQIFYERNMIHAGQINVAQDGSYTHVITTGPLWSKDGEYIIRATYGEGRADTHVDYYPKTEIPETTEIFEVPDGNSGTFDVEYTIKGGSVKGMVIDQGNFALVITIESENGGIITLDLPRSAIDAMERDSDVDFIILIDDIQIPYEEPKKDLKSRVITMQFEGGDSEIMIIGTHIIPEFGTMAIAVLAMVTMMAVLLTRGRLKL